MNNNVQKNTACTLAILPQAEIILVYFIIF
jgi:hypothetical protein